MDCVDAQAVLGVDGGAGPDGDCPPDAKLVESADPLPAAKLVAEAETAVFSPQMVGANFLPHAEVAGGIVDKCEDIEDREPGGNNAHTAPCLDGQDMGDQVPCQEAEIAAGGVSGNRKPSRTLSNGSIGGLESDSVQSQEKDVHARACPISQQSVPNQRELGTEDQKAVSASLLMISCFRADGVTRHFAAALASHVLYLGAGYRRRRPRTV